MSIQQPHLKLQALRDLLRDPSRWPPSFGPWNYRNWSTCAIGLAYEAGIITSVGQEFNLPPRDFDAIFAGAAESVRHNTTPGEVADRIDAYIAGRAERVAENHHGWRTAFAVAS